MLSVAGAKRPNKVAERAVLYDSLVSTPKRDASSKTRAGAEEGALDTLTGTEKAPSRTAGTATGGSVHLRVVWESLWEKYEKLYDVELGGSMEVAVRKAPSMKLVYVRVFTNQATPETLYVYRRLQYQNIITALEAFTTDDSLYIVLEYMPLSLE